MNEYQVAHQDHHHEQNILAIKLVEGHLIEVIERMERHLIDVIERMEEHIIDSHQVLVESLRQQGRQYPVHAIEVMEGHIIDAIGKMTRREQ